MGGAPSSFPPRQSCRLSAGPSGGGCCSARGCWAAAGDISAGSAFIVSSPLFEALARQWPGPVARGVLPGVLGWHTRCWPIRAMYFRGSGPPWSWDWGAGRTAAVSASPRNSSMIALSSASVSSGRGAGGTSSAALRFRAARLRALIQAWCVAAGRRAGRRAAATSGG